MSVPPHTPPPLIPPLRDLATLERVDLRWIRANFPRYKPEQPLSELDAMYAAYTWSEAKHGGRGPHEQEPPPGPDLHDCEIVGFPSDVQYRVYLNTTDDGASTVSEWLDGWVHKRGARGWATHRRDAIIIYVRKKDPSLQDVLDALAVYQAENPTLFVDERVRLTRPAVGQRGGQPVKLVGVGIADEVLDLSRSFSDVAADAVLRARKATEEGPGTFESHLLRELEQVGRAPGDPSREHYVLSVGGRRVVVGDRQVTGAQIMSAAEVDSTTHDLYVGLRRFTGGDLIFVRRNDAFGVVGKGAPTPPLKPPNLQKT